MTAVHDADLHEPILISWVGRPDRMRTGLWAGEADAAYWTDAFTGNACLILRLPSGAFGAYVGVPFEHHLNGADHQDVDVVVHGGLTVSGVIDIDYFDDRSLWFFGFHCEHLDDVMPLVDEPVFAESVPAWLGCTYRSLDWVIAETTQLAMQLVF